MSHIYLVPQWFFGLSIGLEIVFAVAAFIVSAYAFKVYKLSGQRESRLLTTAFALISASYFVKALFNFFVLTEVSEGVIEVAMENLNLFGAIGLYSYIMLFTSGLVTLAYMTFRIKSKRAYSLLLATNIIILVFSQNKTAAFSLFSSLLLFYICIHYFLEYQKYGHNLTLVVFSAFILLLFSGIGFIFAGNYYINYVIGHLFELGSYLLILTSLILTLRKK